MTKNNSKLEEIVVDAEIIETPELAVTYTPATIDDNLAALETYVDSQLALYIGTTIDPNDEQQIKGGRNAAAALNKLKEPIESERKRIKREYEKPLKAFEAKVKSITLKIDNARADIKAQIDTADRLFKDDRHVLLKEEYEGAVGIMADVISFDAILDPKWLNRSTPEIKAIHELEDAAIKAKEGYDTLMAKQLNHKDEVMAKYATTLDMIAALKLEDELNEKDRQMAEFKARQEEMERAWLAVQRECEKTATQVQPEPELAPEAPQVAVDSQSIISRDDLNNKDIYRFSIEVPKTVFYTTKAEAIALRNHLSQFAITANMTKSAKAITSKKEVA